MPVDIDITVNKVPPAQNSPSLPPQPSGHPNQQIWLPLHYHDKLPPNPPIISVSKELVDEPVQFMGCASPESIPIPKDTEFCTETNTFWVYHKYTFGPPTFNPNESFTLSSVSNSISIAHNPTYFSSDSSRWSPFGSSTLEAVENADNFSPF